LRRIANEHRFDEILNLKRWPAVLYSSREILAVTSLRLSETQGHIGAARISLSERFGNLIGIRSRDLFRYKKQTP
jgi:hypothetical protein